MAETTKKIDFNKKLMADSEIIFREENDQWAILFDPDRDKTYTLNPVSSLIWKHMDGQHNVNEIKKRVLELCVDVPGNSGEEIDAFVEQLLIKNMVQYV